MIRIREWINKSLIALRIKKAFIWTPPELEEKILEKAYQKTFGPTIKYIKELNKDEDYKIQLSYVDMDEKKQTNNFKVKLINDEHSGIKFKITLPEYLNVGGVKHKESYGLTEELRLTNKNRELFIPENSVSDFETKFPFIPQILNGRFNQVRSVKENPPQSYFRLIIPIKDKEMIFPSSILEYAENHMKFDFSAWDRQMTLMGIPFMSTKGMFAELTIKGNTYHYYGIEQIRSHIIDSINTVSLELFKKVAYTIRLCFAFLSGRLYRDEVVCLASNSQNFSKITFFEYLVEEPSVITDNRIINPTFFFGQYKEKDQETQEKWKQFHRMFDVKLFSKMCEKVLDSPEFERSMELIVNAGNISDPVQKGALYSVCIETLTELFRNENEDSFKPISRANNLIWEELRRELKNSLEQFNGRIDEGGYAILDKKIDNLNSPTNRDKLEKPFKMLNIELSPSELITLNERNNYLHGGQPDNKEWIVMSNLSALKLHNLIGMLILKYFNYSGHYINVAGWFLLHDKEIKGIMEKFDFNELKEVMKKINKEEFDSVNQLDRAKKTLKNFEKFNIAASEIEGLIKII